VGKTANFIVIESTVSVVTPFHNSAPYLAECIESVLAQTYGDFEYILSDNCSTDGSTDIAQSYARRDPRIRFVRQPQLLSQVTHYNAALTRISNSSQYCKIVQADDFIFSDCLRSMVQAFEQSESIGLVSAYDLKRAIVRGSGLPFRKGGIQLVSGKEVAQLVLLTGAFFFGSPTSVMYRASIVRSNQQFFQQNLLHEDTEKCMEILQAWDFGFVHQVLSFLRADNESISSAVRTFQPDMLDRYIIVQRYAVKFLKPGEAGNLQRKTKRDYYSMLARQAIHFRSSEFWHYHRGGLETLHEKLDGSFLTLCIGRELLWMFLNPGMTMMRLMQSLRRSTAPK
jgi:glycosyltransferase involved in cell wall biosynthesis